MKRKELLPLKVYPFTFLTGKYSKVYASLKSLLDAALCLSEIQSNFSGSNIFGTMKNSSRQG